MTKTEIIKSLKDQAEDKKALDDGDADSIFTQDAQALLEATEMLEKLTARLEAAETDIAAILWLNGECKYCKYAQKVEYSGANRLECRFGSAADCRPEWIGQRRT